MGIDVDYPAGSAVGGGDITDVGNVSSGEAFTAATPGLNLTWENATSGTITLQTVAGALGTQTLSFPAETGTLLTTVTSLVGDVTGTFGATVVGDDSHAHTGTTLSAIPITDLNTFSSTELATQLTDETGTGLAVFNDTPTIITPTIASFTNAQHDHTDAASGGLIVRLTESDFIDNETPAGDLDGVDTTYTLANAPSPAASLKLYLNLGRLREGAANDYTLSGSTITFNFAPVADDVLLADYRF